MTFILCVGEEGYIILGQSPHILIDKHLDHFFFWKQNKHLEHYF